MYKKILLNVTENNKKQFVKVIYTEKTWQHCVTCYKKATILLHFKIFFERKQLVNLHFFNENCTIILSLYFQLKTIL